MPARQQAAASWRSNKCSCGQGQARLTVTRSTDARQQLPSRKIERPVDAIGATQRHAAALAARRADSADQRRLLTARAMPALPDVRAAPAAPVPSRPGGPRTPRRAGRGRAVRTRPRRLRPPAPRPRPPHRRPRRGRSRSARRRGPRASDRAGSGRRRRPPASAATRPASGAQSLATVSKASPSRTESTAIPCRPRSPRHQDRVAGTHAAGRTSTPAGTTPTPAVFTKSPSPLPRSTTLVSPVTMRTPTASPRRASTPPPGQRRHRQPFLQDRARAEPARPCAGHRQVVHRAVHGQRCRCRRRERTAAARRRCRW